MKISSKRTNPAILCLLLLFVDACIPQQTAAIHPTTLVLPKKLPAEEVVRIKNAANAYVTLRVIAPQTIPMERNPDKSPLLISGASGTVLDARGYIVTPAHIAKSTDYVAEIRTVNRHFYPATIINVMPDQELALLQAKELPADHAPVWGDTGALKKGDKVFAIGTPDNRPDHVAIGEVLEPDYQRTVRYGEYAYNRSILLHLDIKPGYSGGPLFNAQGELIGMLASLVLKPGTTEPGHLALAIPVDILVDYLKKTVDE